MISVNFELNNIETAIQCKANEKMKNICNYFVNKVGKDIKSLFFIYDGKILNENLLNLSFNEIANKIDKERNVMKILANEVITDTEINKKIISKAIICPECVENIRIDNSNYKIKLFDCKNDHIKYLNFKEFENTQKVDESKIICDNCKERNKLNSYKNLFYKCNICEMNLCSICKNKHNDSHDIINYDLKNYTCEFHNEKYISYCKSCKKNICSLCLDEHEEHNTELFKGINIDKNKEELSKLRKAIDKMVDDIKIIISKLNIVIENIEIYYKICENLVKNYDNKKRNYQIIKNMNNIFNKEIINDINKIINNENDKYIKIEKIYNEIIKEKANDNIKKQILTKKCICQEKLKTIDQSEIKSINPKKIQTKKLNDYEIAENKINKDYEKEHDISSFRMSKKGSETKNKGKKSNKLNKKANSPLTETLNLKIEDDINDNDNKFRNLNNSNIENKRNKELNRNIYGQNNNKNKGVKIKEFRPIINKASQKFDKNEKQPIAQKIENQFNLKEENKYSLKVVSKKVQRFEKRKGHIVHISPEIQKEEKHYKKRIVNTNINKTLKVEKVEYQKRKRENINRSNSSGNIFLKEFIKKNSFYNITDNFTPFSVSNNSFDNKNYTSQSMRFSSPVKRQTFYTNYNNNSNNQKLYTVNNNLISTIKNKYEKNGNSKCFDYKNLNKVKDNISTLKSKINGKHSSDNLHFVNQNNNNLERHNNSHEKISINQRKINNLNKRKSNNSSKKDKNNNKNNFYTGENIFPNNEGNKNILSQNKKVILSDYNKSNLNINNENSLNKKRIRNNKNNEFNNNLNKSDHDNNNINSLGVDKDDIGNKSF